MTDPSPPPPPDKQLGDLVLPDEIQWIDQYDQVPVAMETARTIGGQMAIWTAPLTAGQPLTLQCAQGYSWLTLAQVQALQAMVAIPGAVYTLVWFSDSFPVMFDIKDGSACKFTPIAPGYWLFNVEIKLITV